MNKAVNKKETIILLKNTPKLGKIGDVVSVKSGYARNYILPSKEAILYTKENFEVFEEQRKIYEERYLDEKNIALERLKTIEDNIIAIITNSSDDKKLFGSINKKTLAKKLKELGYENILYSQLSFETIRSLGLYPCKIQLHNEVSTTFYVNIGRNQDELDSQEAEFKSSNSAKSNEISTDQKAEELEESLESISVAEESSIAEESNEGTIDS